MTTSKTFDVVDNGGSSEFFDEYEVLIPASASAQLLSLAASMRSPKIFSDDGKVDRKDRKETKEDLRRWKKGMAAKGAQITLAYFADCWPAPLDQQTSQTVLDACHEVHIIGILILTLSHGMQACSQN
ncbi:hypothetical protein V5O48_001823 [Marasmius crinis-equi]|uniref:Uncharacterized protein n=1 Tax=Marasmius crinis-equi TaxID=585013 RepID=A0ABR3FX94_9AGAR